jgi:hypothetical protein
MAAAAMQRSGLIRRGGPLSERFTASLLLSSWKSATVLNLAAEEGAGVLPPGVIVEGPLVARRMG